MLDVIVIGGGPAGSAVATWLVRQGRRVLVIEKEHFPRFAVGESLLPYTTPLLDDLGVSPALDQAFIRKHGAEFVTADGEHCQRYSFADSLLPHPAYAWQVERSHFDEMLLNNAAEAGAEVEQGVVVRRVDLDAKGPASVEATGPAGDRRCWRARLVIDAAGRGSPLARQSQRKVDPKLRNIAVYTHVEGAERREGDRAGDISIVICRDGWWWLIPLKNGRTSVGFVAPRRAFPDQRLGAGFLIQRALDTQEVAKRLADARRVEQVRIVSDYSFSCRRIVGENWLAVGDAAGFVDPVFSAGVHLALSGAKRAAEAADRALDGHDRKQTMKAYARWHTRQVECYRQLVLGFYTPAFRELLLFPSDWLDLRRGMTSLLAGAGSEPFAVTWRSRVFGALARINRRLPVTPRRHELAAAGGDRRADTLLPAAHGVAEE